MLSCGSRRTPPWPVPASSRNETGTNDATTPNVEHRVVFKVGTAENEDENELWFFERPLGGGRSDVDDRPLEGREDERWRSPTLPSCDRSGNQASRDLASDLVSETRCSDDLIFDLEMSPPSDTRTQPPTTSAVDILVAHKVAPFTSVANHDQDLAASWDDDNVEDALDLIVRCLYTSRSCPTETSQRTSLVGERSEKLVNVDSGLDLSEHLIFDLEM